MKDRMSQSSQERLVRVVDRVVDMVAQDDISPTDALYKVAQEEKLPAGHVELAARVYNISRSESHRKEAEDFLGRIESVPLIDAGSVLERMYPDEVKSPAQKQAAQRVSGEYDRPPQYVDQRQKQASVSAFEEMAQKAGWFENKNAAILPHDPDEDAKVAMGRMRVLVAEAEEARVKLGSAHDAANRSLHDLWNYLMTPGSLPYAQVIKLAGQYVSPVFRDGLHNYLKTVRGVDREDVPYRLKMASDKTAPVPLLQKLAKQCDAVEEAQKAYDMAVAKAQEVEQQLMAPFVGPGNEAIPLPWEKGATLGVMAGVMGTTMAREIAQRLPTNEPVGKLEGKVYKKLTDPIQEAEIRNARLTAALSRLHATDPVISGYPLEEVTGAANGIGQLSPRALESEELMRALLRKQLQAGQMDPYEINTLLDIERKMKYRDSASEGGVLNAGSSAGGDVLGA